MSGKSSEDPAYNGSSPNGQMPRDAIPPQGDGGGVIFGGPVAAWLRERGGYALRGFRNADFRRCWFMMLADTFGIWSTNMALPTRGVTLLTVVLESRSQRRTLFQISSPSFKGRFHSTYRGVKTHLI